MRGERIGAMIGSIGGLVFVVVNAGRLPGVVGTVVRVAGVLAFGAVVWFAVIRPRATSSHSEPPSRRAVGVYGASVTAMGLGIPVGASLLNNVLHLPLLTLPWVVFVVGAHFLPFARVFHAPVFARLAWTLVAVAVAGGVVTLAATEAAGPWTGVLAGVVLLGYSAAGSGRAVPPAAKV